MKRWDLALHDILVVPSLSKNLLSMQHLCVDNHVDDFNEHRMRVEDWDSGKIQLQNDGGSSCILLTEKADLEMWHRRLNHLNFSSLNNLA